MMTIWIDTSTGTWGSTEALVIVDLDNLGDKNSNALAYIEYLDDASDSEINEFGRQHGRPVSC